VIAGVGNFQVLYKVDNVTPNTALGVANTSNLVVTCQLLTRIDDDTILSQPTPTGAGTRYASAYPARPRLKFRTRPCIRLVRLSARQAVPGSASHAQQTLGTVRGPADGRIVAGSQFHLVHLRNMYARIPLNENRPLPPLFGL
jgi:hypothetical protein